MTNKKTNKTEFLQFRMTPELKGEIQKEADKRNIGMADFVKICIFNELERIKQHALRMNQTNK